jgi:hypothetical protein
MGDEMTAERKAIEEARWKRGESHLCLGCGRLPPHQGCAAICPACTPPNGTCDCAGCSLASAQALKAIGERDEERGPFARCARCDHVKGKHVRDDIAPEGICLGADGCECLDFLAGSDADHLAAAEARASAAEQRASRAESALASARSEALEEAAKAVEARFARPGMGTMEAIAERDAVVEAIRSLKATAPTGGSK